MNELDEIQLEAYKNNKFYKEKLKKFYDSFIARKEFVVGDKVLLYKSKLRLMGGKLRSKWIGLFVVTYIFPYGAVKIKSESTNKSFKVNGHHVKLFLSNPYLLDTVVEETSLLDATSLLTLMSHYFSFIPLPFYVHLDGCLVLNFLFLVHFQQLVFIEPLFRILIVLALIGIIFVSNYFVGIFVKQFWSLDTNFKMKR